jgi:hypothetical protein
MLCSGDIYLRASDDMAYIVYLVMAIIVVRAFMLPMCFAALQTPRVFIHNICRS